MQPEKSTVEIIASDGNVLATLGSGSFYGEMALLMKSPRSATARTVDYCDLYMLNRELFERLLARFPNFEKHVKEIAVQRLGNHTGRKGKLVDVGA